MTADQCATQLARIAAMVADWNRIGQPEQGKFFREQMWNLLGPYIRGRE